MNRPNEPFVGIAIALLITVGLYAIVALACIAALAIETAVFK